MISQFDGGLPGLSVDIDLVCLPVTEREDSLRGIVSPVRNREACEQIFAFGPDAKRGPPPESRPRQAVLQLK